MVERISKSRGCGETKPACRAITLHIAELGESQPPSKGIPLPRSRRDSENRRRNRRAEFTEKTAAPPLGLKHENHHQKSDPQHYARQREPPTPSKDKDHRDLTAATNIPEREVNHCCKRAAGFSLAKHMGLELSELAQAGAPQPIQGDTEPEQRFQRRQRRPRTSPLLALTKIRAGLSPVPYPP